MMRRAKEKRNTGKWKERKKRRSGKGGKGYVE